MKNNKSKVSDDLKSKTNTDTSASMTTSKDVEGSAKSHTRGEGNPPSKANNSKTDGGSFADINYSNEGSTKATLESNKVDKPDLIFNEQNKNNEFAGTIPKGKSENKLTEAAEADVKMISTPDNEKKPEFSNNTPTMAPVFERPKVNKNVKTQMSNVIDQSNNTPFGRYNVNLDDKFKHASKIANMKDFFDSMMSTPYYANLYAGNSAGQRLARSFEGRNWFNNEIVKLLSTESHEDDFGIDLRDSSVIAQYLDNGLDGDFTASNEYTRTREWRLISIPIAGQISYNYGDTVHTGQCPWSDVFTLKDGTFGLYFPKYTVEFDDSIKNMVQHDFKIKPAMLNGTLPYRDYRHKQYLTKLSYVKSKLVANQLYGENTSMENEDDLYIKICNLYHELNYDDNLLLIPKALAAKTELFFASQLTSKFPISSLKEKLLKIFPNLSQVVQSYIRLFVSNANVSIDSSITQKAFVEHAGLSGQRSIDSDFQQTWKENLYCLPIFEFSAEEVDANFSYRYSNNQIVNVLPKHSIWPRFVSKLIAHAKTQSGEQWETLKHPANYMLSFSDEFTAFEDALCGIVRDEKGEITSVMSQFNNPVHTYISKLLSNGNFKNAYNKGISELCALIDYKEWNLIRSNGDTSFFTDLSNKLWNVSENKPVSDNYVFNHNFNFVSNNDLVNPEYIQQSLLFDRQNNFFSNAYIKSNEDDNLYNLNHIAFFRTNDRVSYKINYTLKDVIKNTNTPVVISKNFHDLGIVDKKEFSAIPTIQMLIEEGIYTTFDVWYVLNKHTKTITTAYYYYRKSDLARGKRHWNCPNFDIGLSDQYLNEVYELTPSNISNNSNLINIIKYFKHHDDAFITFNDKNENLFDASEIYNFFLIDKSKGLKLDLRQFHEAMYYIRNRTDVSFESLTFENSKEFSVETDNGDHLLTTNAWDF